MKLWIDAFRPAPAGFYHAYSVEEAIHMIRKWENEIDYTWEQYILGAYDEERFDRFMKGYTIQIISCSYDFVDGIKFSEWLEATGRNYPIHIHGENPIEFVNIEQNGWKEIK